MSQAARRCGRGTAAWSGKWNPSSTVRRKTGVAARLALSVGGAEEDLGPWDHDVPGMDIAARRRWLQGNAMVRRARDLAAIVREKGSATLDFTFREYPGRSHQPAKIIASLDAVEEAVSCRAPSRPEPVR